MSRFWRASAITLVGLFLETCAFYLVIAAAGAFLQQEDAILPFWLVFLTLLWSYLLSGYIQSLPVSVNLRGTAGLAGSALSLLVLALLRFGFGPAPWGQVAEGDLDAAFRLFLSLGFLVLLLWRGVTMAHEEVSLDTVRASFRWGLAVLLAAAFLATLNSDMSVSGYLVVGFFAVGLAGLSVARLSTESGGRQAMPRGWWVPIGISVGTVIALGLLISAAGMGGLDEVTRALLRLVADIGVRVLKPVLLALGYLTGLLVALASWVSGWFGGGDLGNMQDAQEEFRQFQEQLRLKAGDGGPPAVLVAFLKGAAFTAALGLAGWLVYRIFRFRRTVGQGEEVQETRESTFSWSRANRDLASLLAQWRNNLARMTHSGNRGAGEPATPREFYHGLLALAAKLGRPRQDWQTPKEHQIALRGVLPGEPVGRIVDSFQMAHYGGAEFSPRDMDGLRRDWLTLTQFVREPGRRE